MRQAGFGAPSAIIHLQCCDFIEIVQDHKDGLWNDCGDRSESKARTHQPLAAL
jgi:hypothetical protein